MKKNKLARTIGFVPFQLFLIFFICFNTLAGHATEEITNKTVVGKQMTIHLKNKKVKDVFEYIEKTIHESSDENQTDVQGPRHAGWAPDWHVCLRRFAVA